MHFPDELKGRYEPVQLFLKDHNGQIYGGLVGEICWNWLEVHYVFVDETLRQSGYGKALLSEAEAIAKSRKCNFIKLDTLSFQALDFYQKQGYIIYGTIPNAGGYNHYYLTKRINYTVE